MTTLIYLAFDRLLTLTPSRRPSGKTAVMDTFAALAHGMAVAVQPMNLLYALIGVFLGTAVGVLPGIGPALTVALLLPVTYKLDPGGSLIMFAGIYYGGMYGGSTTAILINTPGESASMATALEGNKMAKAGRGGPALATSAIGSFVAGTHRHHRPRLPRAVAGRFRGALRAGGLFRADVRRLRHGVGDLRRFADPRTDQPVHRADARPDRHRQAHRTGPARFRHSRTARRRRGDDAGGRPVRGRRSALRRLAPSSHRGEARAGARLAVDDQGRLEAVVEAVAARHAVRLSDRRASGRRRRDPDLPVLLHREAAGETSRGIRQGRHRRRRRTGSRQQRFRRRHAGAAADARAADLGNGRDDAGGLSAIRPQPGTAAVRRAARPGVGPDREPVHRQRHAAGAQPAAGRLVGDGCSRSRSRGSTPAFSCSRPWARSRQSLRSSNCRCWQGSA